MIPQYVTVISTPERVLYETALMTEDDATSYAEALRRFAQEIECKASIEVKKVRYAV